jgi:hypothetical protein
VIEDFFLKLPPNQHELIVFDLNRSQGTEFLFKNDPAQAIEVLLADRTLPFTYGIVRNRNSSTPEVVLALNAHEGSSVSSRALGMAWPEDVFSLSHVALPFPPDDSLYGGAGARESPGIRLGNVALRGEKGTLNIPSTDMLRQRWNPFYDLIERRAQAFLFDSD